VRDVTTGAAATLSPDLTLEEAARLFTNERVSGAAVVEGGKVVGILSTADLIERSPFIPHSPKAHVSDAMTRTVVTARLNEPAMSVVHLMVQHRIHRVVVVDAGDRAVGIVTSLDVLDALASGVPIQFGDAAFEQQAERHSDPAAAVSMRFSRADGFR